MADKFYRDHDLIRYGYQRLPDNVTAMHLCIDPEATDDLATLEGKSIATTAFGAADVSFGDEGPTGTFFMNLAGKNIPPTAPAAETDDIAIVYVSSSKMLLMLDAGDRIITNESGDIVAIAPGKLEAPAVIEKVA